jgi:hypothetical protein
MGITELLISTLISVTLSIAAAILLRPKADKKPLEDMPTTTSTRGEWLYSVSGTIKVEPVFAFAGNRYTTQKKVDGGKGLGGSQKQTVYHEAGWHLLSVGVGVEIRAIYNSEGKDILGGTIDRDTYPSGSTVTTEIGDFVVFWGERDQGVSPDLAHATLGVGVASAWPDVFYVYWTSCELGPSPMWPRLSYVIKVGCDRGLLLDSEYWIGDDGVNPAHRIAERLLLPYPWGVHLDNDDVDKTSLEAFGVLCEEEGLALNMIGERGVAAERDVQAILSDCGVMMSQIDGRLVFISMRKADDFPVLSDEIITEPGLDIEVVHAQMVVSSPTFTYLDRDHKYRDKDIRVDDDADTESYKLPASSRVKLEIPTEEAVARIIAVRREQELAISGKHKFGVLRNAKVLRPGHGLFEASVGKMRVLTVKPDIGGPGAEVEASFDTYSIDAGDELGDESTGGGSGGSSLPEVDIAFNWLQVPAALYPSGIAIGVFRLRAHQRMTGSDIHVSQDDVSYTDAGSQNQYCCGGTILTAFDGTSGDITNGPIFEDINGDVPNVALDLSSDTTSWENGRQIMLVEDEIMYVQALTAVSVSAWAAATVYIAGDEVLPTIPNGFRYVCLVGGTSGADEPAWPVTRLDDVTDNTVTWETYRPEYRIDGIKRAKHGTAAAVHAIGTHVFITPYDAIHPIADVLIEDTVLLYVKSRPRSSRGYVDLSSVTAIDKVV